MPSAELIAIGTELLLGEIQDTNTRYLARQLRDIGVEIYRTMTIGDNTARIAEMIDEAFSRADIVITTGGLGPTVDDPTREAVALAFHTATEFHPELWVSIEQRFLKRGVVPPSNNRRQAYLPQGAKVIENLVGTAPAFYIENSEKVLISLPGVPREMEALTESTVLPYLKQKFSLHGTIKVRVLHIAGVGESRVDELIGDLETLANPTVGLLAHPGIVDVRITAKASSQDEADHLIASIEKKVRAVFSNDIYGADDVSLAHALLETALQKNIKITFKSSGLNGLWPQELIADPTQTIKIIEAENNPSNEQSDPSETSNSTLMVTTNYSVVANDCLLNSHIRSGHEYWSDSGMYNGPLAQGTAWAINRVLDFIRRTIIFNK